MIKNDRQYRLTKLQLQTFESSLKGWGGTVVPAGVEPQIFAAQGHALESTVEDLRGEIFEYEELSSGAITHFSVGSLMELPRVLIRARIARGFTQQQFAEKLGLREQQVQRWEANDYAGASIETLDRVSRTLEIAIREDIFLPARGFQPRTFLKNLEAAGIPFKLMLHRLLPPDLTVAFEDPDQISFKEVVQAASCVARVFSVRIQELLQTDPPQFDLRAVAETHFKLPARVNKKAVNAYTIYAHYLAALAVSCVRSEPKRDFPDDWHQFNQAVRASGGTMTFASALSFLWDCGVIVLPLRDSGNFHGAVWEVNGRRVIALKQNMELSSRWLFDLIHEAGHIASGHVDRESSILEEQEISPGKRDELTEMEANQWAEATASECGG